MDSSRRSKLEIAMKFNGIILIQTKQTCLQQEMTIFALSTDTQNSSILNFSIACQLFQFGSKIYAIGSTPCLFSFLTEYEKDFLGKFKFLNLKSYFQAYKEESVKFSVILEDHNEERFYKLKPKYIFYDQDYYDFFHTLFDKNSHLGFKKFDSSHKTLKDHLIQNLLFGVFEVWDMIEEDDDIINKKRIFPDYLKAYEQRISDKAPEQGQSIYTLGSPFAILSSELYKGILHKGVISNVFNVKKEIIGFKKFVFTIDSLNINGNDGAAVLDEDFRLLGAVLPPLLLEHKKTKYVTFAINYSFLLNAIIEINKQNFNDFENDLESEILKPFEVKNINPNLNPLIYNISQICLIIYKSNWASGILIDRDQGLILSVLHVFDSRKNNNDDQNLFIQFPSSNYMYKAKIEELSSGSYDLSLIKIVDQKYFSNYKNLCPQKLKFPQNSDICVGENIFAIGFGIFSPKFVEFPMVSKGIISKIIYDKKNDNIPKLIQTDCAIYNGFSGGGLFNSKGEFLGIIIYSINDAVLGVIEKMNFSYHFLQISSLLNQKGKKLECKDIFIDKASELQTRESVPIYKCMSKL